MVDGARQPLPIGQLGIEQRCTGGSQAVVLARRAIIGLLPGGIDQTLALEPSQEGVKGALGCRQGLPLTERDGDLVAVAGRAADEQEHAQLDDAAARLGKPLAGLGVVHRLHGTTRYCAAQGSGHRHPELAEGS